MAHQRLLARSSSGAAAVATVGVATWFGEQGSKTAVSQMTSRTNVEAATRLLRWNEHQQANPCRGFATSTHTSPLIVKSALPALPVASPFATLARHNVFAASRTNGAVTANGQRRLFNAGRPAAKPTSTAQSAPSAKAAAGATATARPTFVQWYESHLAERPVPTKMISGAILWGLGDGVAQVMPVMNGSQHVEYDPTRMARAVVYGFAIHAPASHVHFNFLEWMTVKAGFTGLTVPIFKTIMEQFVYWSWLSNGMYHGFMGAVQGLTPAQIYDRLCDVMWDTQKAQWAIWIPIQLLNFKFVPVRHQLNVVLVMSVVWAALMSTWYPPEEEEAKPKLESSQKA